jgi:hypothetical protein
LEDYFDASLYAEMGDCSTGEWPPELIRNHLCALESQKRVYAMVRETREEFDFFLFMRPDVFVETPIDVTWFSTDHEIVIKDDRHYEGYNDLFAIVRASHAAHYACRIDGIAEFRRTHGRIVAEKYLAHVIKRYFHKVRFVKFIVRIVRPSLSTTQI